MASEVNNLPGARRLALGIGLRGLFIGLLAFSFCEMLLMRRYASASILLVLAVLTALDLNRQAHHADGLLSRFLSALQSGQPEMPMPGPGASPTRLHQTMQHIHDGLTKTRQQQQVDHDYLRALMDTVSAALIVIETDGRFVRLNRAARQLSESVILQGENADRLKTLSPGERIIIHLDHARRTLAVAAEFSHDGQTRKLISLQNIQTELDAAEIKAWQDLVRILAHEMMNSLTPIASLSQSLRPMVREADEDVLAAIEMIGARSHGLMQFVERYREVAELPRPVIRSIALRPFMTSLESLLTPSLASKGIASTWTVEPAALSVRADAQLLEQAMINILHNAMDALQPVAAPVIAVRAFQDQDQVILSVSDNGPGIAPELRERIFVPFFTTKSAGSGIGLSLVRQTALAHHGQVEVLSHNPSGAVFRLYLPA